LLERRFEDAALREHTAVILREADRLGALVERVMGPAGPPRRTAVNVHEPLEHVLRLVAAEAGVGLELNRDYDPSLPELRADRDQLVQALLNIARNAVQATGGRGRLSARTRALRQFTIGGRRHRLAVAIDLVDDGPGIPGELRDTLFYPLVSGRPEGRGLGLSIAADLVDRHGGTIEWDSRPGETRFTVILPVAGEEAAAHV
jgi:two-component system nitrogen regulation sensor histidine kinase GlnL